MNNQQFNQKINELYDSLTRKQKDALPHVIANSATKYYKERFKAKAWGSRAWPTYTGVKQPKRGSLMLRTTKLQGSIIASTITVSKVIITAGNAQVPYARAHNEGLRVTATATVREHRRTRKFKTKKGFRTRTFDVRSHQRKMNLQHKRRQFMGKNSELLAIIKTDIVNILKKH